MEPLPRYPNGRGAPGTPHVQPLYCAHNSSQSGLAAVQNGTHTTSRTCCVPAGPAENKGTHTLMAQARLSFDSENQRNGVVTVTLAKGAPHAHRHINHRGEDCAPLLPEPLVGWLTPPGLRWAAMVPAWRANRREDSYRSWTQAFQRDRLPLTTEDVRLRRACFRSPRPSFAPSKLFIRAFEALSRSKFLHSEPAKPDGINTLSLRLLAARARLLAVYESIALRSPTS